MRIFTALSAVWWSANAVLLPQIFRDGVVLQTPADGGAPARVFGYALPGEAVVVRMTILGHVTRYDSTADATTGHFSVVVAPGGPDLAPRGVSFSVAAASDAVPTEFGNASFGDVILCNGQSNVRDKPHASYNYLLATA